MTACAILNNYYRVNADGIDPVSCRRVRISNCSIVAGDDCIVCKTRGTPVRGYRRDELRAGIDCHGGEDRDGIAQRLPQHPREQLRDPQFDHRPGLFLKDGGTAERIGFSNCTIETIRQPELASDSLKDSIYPIFVDIEKRQADSRIGRIRDLNFSDISILSDSGILMQGMTAGRIENVSMGNVTMRIDKAADYAKRKKHVGGKTEPTEDRRETIYARQPSYVTLANIDGLTVNGLRVLIPDEVFAKYNRSALSLHSVSKAVLSDIRREPAGADSRVPVVMMENCRNALLTGCLALPNTGVFLGLAGKETADISIKGSELANARKAIRQSGESSNTIVRE